MPRPTARTLLLSLLLASSATLAAPGCMVEDDGAVDEPATEAPREGEEPADADAIDGTGPDDEPGATELDLEATLAARRADAPNPTTGPLGRGRSPYSPDVVAPDDPQPGDDDDDGDDTQPGPGLSSPPAVSPPR
ncbi:MAG: hypothetical protein KBG28_20435 [Kofleriaceae bacterium]|nr:hypothetical protein [Kofleriaceae bacterium]